MLNDTMNKEEREIVSKVYNMMGWSDYYIDHPDMINDFHGKDLRDAILNTIKIMRGSS